MGEVMVIRVNGKVLENKPIYKPIKLEPISLKSIKSIHKGELEETRQRLVDKWARFLTATYLGVSVGAITNTAFAATEGVEHIRAGFQQVIDVFTAIAEPILWFYALTGCIMMATGKNKNAGWERIKQVGYAYIGIVLLPTFFSFLRWVAVMLKHSIAF